MIQVYGNTLLDNTATFLHIAFIANQVCLFHICFLLLVRKALPTTFLCFGHIAGASRTTYPSAVWDCFSFQRTHHAALPLCFHSKIRSSDTQIPVAQIASSVGTPKPLLSRLCPTSASVQPWSLCFRTTEHMMMDAQVLHLALVPTHK